MSDLFVLGLTGSIGMGKSTTAEVFRDANIAVWDADAAVHELYTSHTETIQAIAELVPVAVGVEGVDRDALSNVLRADPSLFPKIEKIVHPAIRLHRDAFLDACRRENLEMAVVDIPLLYEIGAQDWLDAVLVVTIDENVQRQRVMSRKGMTKETFEMILSKQLPDAQKRKRADFVIETLSLEHVRQEVHKLIAAIKNGAKNA